MSIIAACLPTLAPLFRGGRDPASIVRSVRSILSLRSMSSRQEKYRSSASKDTSREDIKNAKSAWRQLNSSPAHSNDIVHNESTALVDLESQPRLSEAIVVQKSFTNEVERV